MVVPDDGPSVDRVLTISAGPGTTDDSVGERRTVREVDGIDRLEGDRWTRDPDVRSMVGVGSKPFSSMAAIVSALIESDRPADVERRTVARRRRRGATGEPPFDRRAVGVEPVGKVAPFGACSFPR